MNVPVSREATSQWVKGLTAYHFCPVRLKSRQRQPEVRLRGLDAAQVQSAQAGFGSLLVWF
jgi:hypothetical protein